MNVQNIITKYHYDGSLAEFLPKLYTEFVNYFGRDKEPIIYEALLNTEIITCHNIYSALNERGLLEKRADNIVQDGDLKRAAGVYHSLPIINYDPTTNTYSIKDIKRIVAINTEDFSSSYSKTVLIHELSHLIKSYYAEYNLNGDILTTRSGLITSKEQLSIKNDTLVKTPILEESVGLEEGLTSVIEEDIAKILVNPDYKVSGYGVVNAIARLLTDKYNLKEALLNAQVLNEKESIISLFDELLPDLYAKLSSVSDKLYQLSLKMFSEIFDPEKMQATSKTLNEVIITEFHPLVDAIEKNQEKRRN